MESKLEKIREAFRNLIDKITEQQWFQELKGKWEELDPQSRSYLKMAAGGITAFVAVFLVLSSMWSVHTLKRDLADRNDLLNLISSANDELRRLRDVTGGATTGADAGGDWNSYFQNSAQNAGVDPATLAVGTEQAGTATAQTKESLYALELKHVSIKQVIRYAFYLENGGRPVKLRNMIIDTKKDPEGYMDATLAVSAFALKQ